MKNKPYLKIMSFNSKQQGFSLLELTIVIVAIGVLISATSVGSNLQRSASYQKLASSFVRPWELAYLAYFTGTGIVILDNATAPTTKVNQGAGSVCDLALRTAMMAAGIQMPNGRANGYETHYSYLDSNGNPQDSTVCFQNVSWTVNGSSPGVYVQQLKNVMIIDRLTPDLARMLDTMIDGSPDAGFGSFRQVPTAVASTEWSKDNTWVYGGGATNPPLDEVQVDVVTAYWLMNP
jgi:prepilin-type N-terminal cleavage/methylation domain-containing protein